MEEPWLDDVDPEVLRRRRERFVLLLSTILVLALAGVLARALYVPSEPPRDLLLLAAREAVRTAIDVRGTLHFNTPQEFQVTPVEGERYEVRGWATDITPEGLSRSYIFVVTLENDSSRQQFRVADLSVIEQ